jgi:CHRD domain
MDRREEIMHRYGFIAIAVAAVIGFSANYASGQEYSARLNGFNVTGNVPGPTAAASGAIFTNGTGTVYLYLDKNSQTATYKLTYSDLTSTVTQAHIHFGKVHVAGGIMVWLCGNPATNPGPAGTPTCPEPSGTVTGTITATSVQAIATQNVTAGDFDALEDALESNTAYSNVHSVNFPAGELRGQLLPIEKEGDHEHDH